MKTSVLCLLAAPILMAATGGIRGIVHDPQHRPIGGAQVAVQGPDAAGAIAVQSDANGEFQLNGLQEGA